MRWVLTFLLPLFVFANVFEYEVPSIARPKIDTSRVEKPILVVNATTEPLDMEPYFDAMLSMASRVELTDEEIAELKQEYPDLTGSWEGFKKDIDICVNEWLNGSERSLARVNAYRRVYVTKKTFADYPRAEAQLLAGSIDFFDEYDIKKVCEPEDMKTSDGKFVDVIWIDKQKKVHLIRETIACDFEHDPCEVLMRTTDQKQGEENENLAGLKLRTDAASKKLEVKKWRNFVGCMTENYTMGPYPDYTERLLEIGFLEDDIKDANPNEKLALRKFSQHRLRAWREKMPLFTKKSIDELETHEINNWNYYYLIEKNEYDEKKN